MIGETLRKIRKNRNLSQKELAQGIMQQATYSRIESGHLEVSAAHLYQLVERLNISMNEFFYIAQNYKPTPKQQLLQSFARIELTVLPEIEQQLAATHHYLQLHNDEDVLMLYYAYKSMAALVTMEKLDIVRGFAEKVWMRLQKLEHWYLNDLELINSIILYFPLDVAREITQTSIRRLEAYDHFERNTTYLKLYFRLNLSALYLEEENFAHCLDELTQIQQQFQKHLTPQSLGFLITRIMTCKHYLKQNIEQEKPAFNMLEHLFPNEEVFYQLKQELSLNSVPYTEL